MLETSDIAKLEIQQVPDHVESMSKAREKRRLALVVTELAVGEVMCATVADVNVKWPWE